MKAVIFLVAVLGVVPAMAGEVPSDFEDGAYQVECWTQDLIRKEDGTEVRSASNTAGTVDVRTVDGYQQTLERVKNNWGPNTTFFDSIVTNSKVQKLSDGTYREVSVSQGSSVFNGEIENFKTGSDRVFKVAGTREINLKVKIDGEPEREGFGESDYQIAEDGRIIVQSFIRAPFKRPAKDLGDGLIIPAREVLVSNSYCSYKALNK